MDLDAMKYAELRSLAKELGLKANMKMEKLVKAIKQHYQQEQNKEKGVKVTDENKDEKAATNEGFQDVAEPANGENVLSRAVYVNTRRGKGTGTKRNIAEVTAMLDAAQVDNGVMEVDEPKETKKRKTEDMEDGHTGITDELDSRKGRLSKVAKGGKIPRLQGGQQKSKPILKPITPNFKKLHEAHFSKMESIDSYIQRKTKQIDTYRSAVKEAKNLAGKTKPKQVEERAKVTRASVFSPAPVTNKAAEVRRRHTMQSAKKASPVKEAAFRPSVISARRINVHFSEATYDNEHKRSMVKTPARRSSCLASSTPLKPSADRGTTAKATASSATKTPGPFVFTGNTSTLTPGTQKKTQFDLKASLSKPLSYKPHTGKLKPFGDPKENVSANKSLNKSLVSVNSHQEMYKQQRVQTREERRKQQVVGRKQKKQDLLGARRGLVLM